ncbi:PAC2 family protein [Falsarthrobacter nasiphocae]|uniref:PAC2 family protein n=1 Tax=Falsarthrobacter nasiphocae TaxID=189863 RepID=A0AAE4C542_9MICC|nr:PAC2 family protein [Falsarthrobacter nasiphocae]MDR6891113.1 hypothetical protein [Falsarthrobacter nasiphocae]
MTDTPDRHEPATLMRALGTMAASRGENPDAAKTVLLIAFRGWNDAGEAASSVLRRARTAANAPLVSAVTDERFYDYQVLRPRVSRSSSGERSIRWPGVRFYDVGTGAGRDRVIVAYGHEPSFAWRTFAERVMAFTAAEGVDAVVLLGAMLADVPHSRPFPTIMTTEDERLGTLMGLDASTYEGPTGMLGVLSSTFARHGVPALSAWVSVPHYVSQSPSPKAQLALVGALEEIFGVVLQDAQLVDEAEAWERNVEELAENDEDIREYVRRLERTVDAAVEASASLPEVSGDVIAEEIETFLRSYGSGEDDDGAART